MVTVLDQSGLSNSDLGGCIRGPIDDENVLTDVG